MMFNQPFEGVKMATQKLLQYAVALAVAMPVCVFADSLNMKVGTWELTQTTVNTGNFIPADVLGKMPPEQRAKIEQAMQARSGQPQTYVAKHCVTKEDLDQDRVFKSDNESQCTRKIVSKSATRIVMEQTCGAPHATTTTMTAEARTPESVAMTADVVQADGSGKFHMDFHGRWLGASCAGIKEGN